jgi:uroporphyrin-3 C-methyltransferase
MTDKIKKELDNADKPENSEAVANTDHSKKNTSLTAYISLVVAFAALFAAAYSFKQAQLRDASLNEQLLITNKTIGGLVDEQQEFKKAIESADQLSQKKITLFEQKLEGFKKTIQEVDKGSSEVDVYFQLKKAQYYLQLAQINAHWSQQPQTTIELLKQADLLLSGQHQSAIYTIRQQIAEDISTLEKQPKLDIVGLLTKINAIQAQIHQLSYRDDPLLSKSNHQDEKEKADKEGWRQHMANSVNALEKLVVIRHHDHTVKPILSDKQFSLVKEALYGELQQAKWAIINGNQAIYKLTLDQTVKALQQQFNSNQTNVAKILGELESLQQVQFPQSTFEPSKALMLLNEQIQPSSHLSNKTATSGGKH